MVLSVKEFEKCCRCCLLVTDTVPLFSIFDYMHSANIYNEFTALNATKDDGLPQQICQNCIRKLNYAFNFKRMMLDSHKKMIEIVKNFCDSRLESHIDTESVAFDEGKNAQHDIQSDSQIPDSEIKQEPTTEYFYEYDPVSTTSSVSQDTSRNEECQNLTTRKRVDLEEDINKQTSVDRLNTENNVEYQGSNNGTGIELISKQHMKFHTFKCNICNEALELTAKKRHMRSHKDVQECKCNECGRIYADMSLLRRHMKYHGERSDGGYLCTHCGKHFKWKTSLFKHLRYHTGKLYKCKICDKGFADSTYMKTHEMKHYNPDHTFDCEKCEKKFAHISGLTKHQAKKHTDKKC